MSLTWFMIRILSDNHHLNLVKWTQVKGIEYQLTRWIASGLHILLTHRCRQLCKIWFLKFSVKMRLPALFNLYAHIKTILAAKILIFSRIISLFRGKVIFAAKNSLITYAFNFSGTIGMAPFWVQTKALT